MRISQIGYLLLLVAGVLSAKARVRKGGQMSKRVPIYRSLDVEGDADDEIAITKKTKLTLVTGRGNEAGDSRFLKHFLLFKKLSEPDCNSCGSGSGGGGGGGGGSNLVPYVIVNSPSQLTNVNTNVVGAPTSSTTGTTTGTETGTGTGTGTGTATRVGIRKGYFSNSEAMPYPMPQPTPIYQQRDQAYPQIIYGPPLKAVRKTGRQGNRNRNRKKKNTVRTNPFSALANNFKRIQFV